MSQPDAMAQVSFDAGPDESTRARIAREIEAQLMRRNAQSSVCPSEIARALDPGDADWRAWMPAVRAVARQLAREGRLRVTQRDRTLDPDAPWRGAIRLRRPLLRRP